MYFHTTILHSHTTDFSLSHDRFAFCIYHVNQINDTAAWFNHPTVSRHLIAAISFIQLLCISHDRIAFSPDCFAFPHDCFACSHEHFAFCICYTPRALPFVDTTKRTTAISALGKDLTMLQRPFEGVTVHRVGTAVDIVTSAFKVSWVRNPGFCTILSARCCL